MTPALALMAALEPRFGKAASTVHTAMPPFELGGGADVVRFSSALRLPGTIYVTASGSGRELAMCTREDEAFAPPLLCALAAAMRTRDFDVGGSVPLGAPEGPFHGLAFAWTKGLEPVTIAGRFTTFLLAIGVTAGELEFCRTHGTLHLEMLMRHAGLFPYSVRSRSDIAGLSEVGRSPLDREGLTEHGRAGLFAVVHGRYQDVEVLRGRFSPEDLPLLIDAYDDLGSWEQRCELVNLTQDELRDATLHPMYRKVLRDALARPSIDPGTSPSGAVAVAICGLDGGDGNETFMRYFEDVGAAIARAREILGVPSSPVF